MREAIASVMKASFMLVQTGCSEVARIRIRAQRE